MGEPPVRGNQWESAMLALKAMRSEVVEDRDDKKPVLQAKPVVGAVDYDAEFERILKDFPKTIEYLAR